MYHQVNRYHTRDVWPANLQKPRRNNDMARELIYPVETIHEPGRHRFELNMWGTPLTEINADEFCPYCEREVPSHYETCRHRA
jgi:hypothetical protein